MDQHVSHSATGNSNTTDGQRRGDIRCDVISIERSKGPAGAPGSDWYRYVIDSPGSPIIGYRRGKKSEVVEHVDDCMNKLEERWNKGKASRAAAKSKKRQAAK